MKKAIKKVVNEILHEYPNAEGVLFFSLDLPLEISMGKNVDKLLTYKDLPILSIDEDFNSEFTFLIFDKASIITLFMDNNCFISIYVLASEPNKELAREVYLKYNKKFRDIIINSELKSIYES